MLLHSLSSHSNILLPLFFGDERSRGEQVLLGFQGWWAGFPLLSRLSCFISWGFLGGLGCSFGFICGVFFLYSGHKKARTEVGGRNKNPAGLAHGLLKRFGLFQLSGAGCLQGRGL